MPRLSRRRQLFMQNYIFPPGKVPTEFTFDRLQTKLREFQESSDKMRLINSHMPRKSHWREVYDKLIDEDQIRWEIEEANLSAAASEAAKAGKPEDFAPHPLPQRRPQPIEATFGGAPPELQSRLLVLDSSFNPPTRAHAHMAKTAVRDVLREQRQAVAAAELAAAELAKKKGTRPRPVIRPQLRLLLLLAINNADKEVEPAALDHRLAMIYAFSHHLQQDLRRRGDSVPVDMGLTREPFFRGKADALRDASWYSSVAPHMTFIWCDQYGRMKPGRVQMPRFEFIIGFDTLVRILDPKYYKEDASNGEEKAVGDESHQDVEMEDAPAEASYDRKGKGKMVVYEPEAEPSMEASSAKGKEKMPVYYQPETGPWPEASSSQGKRKMDVFESEAESSSKVYGSPSKRKMVAHESEAGPSSEGPSAADSASPQTPQTPMMKALEPFFAQASLRVMLRPGGEWGPRQEQRNYMAALGGEEDLTVLGTRSLRHVGGDDAWMSKVHVLTDSSNTGTTGLSSSKVRDRVGARGAQNARGLVYPMVLDWIQKHRLYVKPRPVKNPEEYPYMAVIDELGDWKKSDFF